MYGAVGELCAGWERAHDHETALQVLYAVWVVCAYAAAGEEVDDTFLEDVRGLCFLTCFVLFDSVCVAVGFSVAIGVVGGLVLRSGAFTGLGLCLDESATRNGRDRGRAF